MRCVTTCVSASYIERSPRLACCLGCHHRFSARPARALAHAVRQSQRSRMQLVIAPDGGDHPNGRSTYGHSSLFDPWGHIVRNSTIHMVSAC